MSRFLKNCIYILKSFFQFRTIQNKLFALISAIIIFSLVALSILNYNKATDVLSKRVEKESLSLAVSSSKQVSSWIQSRIDDIHAIANSPTVKSGNQTEISKYLESEVQRNKLYELIFVSDADGFAFSSTDGVTFDISDRQYFRDILSKDITLVSDPIYSKVSGKLIIVIATPLKVEGKIMGVVGGNVPIEVLQDMVSNIEIGSKEGYSYLIQGDGLPSFAVKF